MTSTRKTTITATAHTRSKLAGGRISPFRDHYRRLGSHQDLCRAHCRMGVVSLHGDEHYRNPGDAAACSQ